MRILLLPLKNYRNEIGERELLQKSDAFCWVSTIVIVSLDLILKVCCFCPKIELMS